VRCLKKGHITNEIKVAFVTMDLEVKLMYKFLFYAIIICLTPVISLRLITDILTVEHDKAMILISYFGTFFILFTLLMFSLRKLKNSNQNS
jgi:bacteriorhodopsin